MNESCTIRGAPMTDAERKMAAAHASIQAVLVNFGCVFVLGGAAAVMLALVFGFLGAILSPAWAIGGRLVGAIIGVWVTLYLAWGVSKPVRLERRRFREDIAAGEVQILEIRAGDVRELEGDHSSIAPALCVDLGEDRLLFLVGQWLWDPGRYARPEGAAPSPPDDLREVYFNGLPPPWSFPSARFTLRRLPRSGHVLSIAPEGAYVAPQRSDIVLEAKEARDYLESQVVKGTPANIVAALETIPKVGPG